ncbi:MAG TPA: type I DNA topoisomerase [Capsulimonadaceae bacterium]|jgi:DNA topoisomerase-1
MPKSLIIVESPAKTKTLKGFLGSDYAVEASMGHIRDLPESKLSVDVENDFKPSYVIIPERKDVLTKLKAALKGVDTVYLASDPDREGEAISWHLAEALKLKNPKRIQFNEITKDAVRLALDSPREIDMNRVDAQQARRVLDRIVGYEISPLLWRKVKKGLSAGRVQSVAVRLITDREREIEAFNAVEYWSLTATLTPDTLKAKFDASLNEYQGKKIELHNELDTNKVLSDLDAATYKVTKVKKAEKRRNAAAPFITSTLQQEASRKLGFNARRTMRTAQQLYEGIDLPGEGSVGMITYMRTDSNRIAAEAQDAARAFISEQYGKDYVPAAPKQFKKGKDAQDAHEAIRPTYVNRQPDSVAKHMTSDQAKLYRLIWQRFVASQMAPAVFDVVAVDIAAGEYTFRATGSTVKFDGFLRVYSEGKDEAKIDDEERPPLPPLSEGMVLKLLALTPKQHFTEPPPRFTEATLVKALEEKGIGRPSTYATIISTIQDRKYVELTEKRFHPTTLGLGVTDLLVKHFPEVMDVTFTAGMELKLDNVEEGTEDWVKVMRDFYGPFHAIVAGAGELMERVKIEPKATDQICPNCGKPMVIRSSRYGEFVGCSGYPECKTIIRPEAAKVETPCPKCGGEVAQKRSKKGTIFYGCTNYPKCDFVAWGKPIGRDCPTCQSPLIENSFRGRPSGIKCSNKECAYKESAKKKSDEDEDGNVPSDADAPAELAAV